MPRPPTLSFAAARHAATRLIKISVQLPLAGQLGCDPRKRGADGLLSLGAARFLHSKLGEECDLPAVDKYRRRSFANSYVTHDQTEAMPIADRVAILRERVLQHIGSPDGLSDARVDLFVRDLRGAPLG
jgi:hypothetical protein